MVKVFLDLSEVDGTKYNKTLVESGNGVRCTGTSSGQVYTTVKTGVNPYTEITEPYFELDGSNITKLTIQMYSIGTLVYENDPTITILQPPAYTPSVTIAHSTTRFTLTLSSSAQSNTSIYIKVSFNTSPISKLDLDTSGLLNASVSPLEYTNGSETTFIINANNGYKFNSAPHLVYTPDNINITATRVSDTVYNVVLNQTLSDDTTDIKIIGSADMITGDICTSDIEDVEINDDLIIPANVELLTAFDFTNKYDPISNEYLTGFTSPKTISFRVPAGYQIKNTSYLECDNVRFTNFVSAGENVYNITITNETPTYKLLTGLIEIESAAEYINVDSSELVNASVLPNTYTNGSETTFIINANNNCYFESAPHLVYTPDNIDLTATRVSDTEYRIVLNATLSDIESDIKIIGSAIAVETLENKYGIIAGHTVTGEIMNTIKQDIYDEDNPDNIIDRSNFILSYHVQFFDPTITDNSKIKLGYYNTDVAAPTIIKDIVKLDLGTYLINGYYNNYLDYIAAKVYLILPFIDMVEIDASKIIGHTINIVYECDSINKKCIAYIYNADSQNKTLIASYNGTIAYEIPYNKGTTEINTNLDNAQLFNVSPAIKIVTKLKATDTTVYETQKHSLIGNEIGYFECNNVNVDTIATTKDELQEIEQLLKSGVYI